LVSRCNSLEAF